MTAEVLTLTRFDSAVPSWSATISVDGRLDTIRFDGVMTDEVALQRAEEVAHVRDAGQSGRDVGHDHGPRLVVD